MSSGYFGTYRGIVTNNKDPENHRRVKVTIPQLVKQDPGKSISAWIWPQENASIKSEVPAIGDGVWVTFEGGDPNYPVWTGVYGKNQQKNKHLFFKPLKNTVNITDITDVLQINKRQDGTSEVDVLDTLLNLSNQHFYGQFYSTATQTGNVSSGSAMTFTNTDISKGVSLTNSSHITFAHKGTYNIQFSTVFTNANNSKQYVEVWFRKNGVDIPWSNTRISAEASSHYIVASWNYLVTTTAANQYVEIMWKPTSTDVTMYVISSGSTPAVPSILATATQIR